jgi:hypothetical protein
MFLPVHRPPLAFIYFEIHAATTLTEGAGFVYEDEFKVRTLVGNGWIRIPRANTYDTYLQLIRDCAAEFPKHRRHDFEMLLFANAEI